MLLTSISRIVHPSASQKLLMDGSRTVAWSVEIGPSLPWYKSSGGPRVIFADSLDSHPISEVLSYIKTMTDVNANTNLYIKCFCPMQLNHNNDLLNLFLRASSGKKLSETLDLTFCQLQLGVKNILMHILCCAFLHKSLFNADLDAPLLNQRIYHCYIILCRILKEHWSFLRSPA